MITPGERRPHTHLVSSGEERGGGNKKGGGGGRGCRVLARTRELPCCYTHSPTEPSDGLFQFEMDQSDGQTQTYASFFAVRSGAHWKHCLQGSKKSNVITLNDWSHLRSDPSATTSHCTDLLTVYDLVLWLIIRTHDTTVQWGFQQKIFKRWSCLQRHVHESLMGKSYFLHAVQNLSHSQCDEHDTSCCMKVVLQKCY